MSPSEFIEKWRLSKLKERSAAQEHFIDLCRLLGEPTPVEADPTGNEYCFERGAQKDSGRDGWADVWKKGCFAWEYKGKYADLNAAFDQLRQYALALENPPLLIVSDMLRIRIRTNWTNSVSQTYEFELDELSNARVREKLKWAMADPEQLKPEGTRQALTERAAETFASLAQSLRDSDHAPGKVAHFVNRLVFCMFAEDVGLLPKYLFSRLLEAAHSRPTEFVKLARTFFRAMSVGDWFGADEIGWFNGGLFEDDAALPMTKAQISMTLKAARLDWSNIDPSILGTLLERGLDPNKRSQLGAHYTDQDKIMRIIDPVIVRPWLARWQTERAKIAEILKGAGTTTSKARTTRLQGKAQRILGEFLSQLQRFEVLDPACGSGNFLYLALHALHDLEHRIQIEAEAMGLQRSFPAIGPANVKGIEINRYAAELARVSVWIGEIQWMRRNGFAGLGTPILDPLETIECRDALLTEQGTESGWPSADVVIGNPPFLGGKLLITRLGEEYVSSLFKVYKDRVPREADLVCYWFVKAGERLVTHDSSRVGLVATNSIRGGANRRALEQASSGMLIFDAWDDEPWVVEGASVRVSLVCFADSEGAPASIGRRLNGGTADEIYADLTARRGTKGLDLTTAHRLVQNKGVAFMGDIKGGPFEVSGTLARSWLMQPVNPNGRPNSDVLKPWVNGYSLMQRPSDKWIISFGFDRSLEQAALYESPFQHAQLMVRPKWESQRPAGRRRRWWLHHSPRPVMWAALEGLTRYIATSRVSKHRVFIWLDRRVCPDSTVIAFARDDDTTLGILQSRFHQIWSRRMGTSLEDRPRYTHTTTLETFPFPVGLTPDISATDFQSNPRAQDIASAARHLVALRDRWLNPPEWVKWVEEPVPGYPVRPVQKDCEECAALEGRTLTALYNSHPQLLVDAHARLDAAVAAAYDWPADISDDLALQRLLSLNHHRPSVERISQDR